MSKNKGPEKQGIKSVKINPSIISVGDSPDSSFELVNKYGTYEIQPTADTDNKFPTIAQGFVRKEQERERLDEKNGQK